MEPMFIPGKKLSNPGASASQTKGTGVPAKDDIIDFVERRLGLHLDPTQRLILTSSAHRVIINSTRQWGKTTVSVLRAVQLITEQPNSLVIIASPTLRQSGEWIIRAEQMLDRLELHHTGDGVNSVSVLLESNDSRIVGLPDVEANVRGFTASMVVIDEAARVTDKMYYKGVRPMLSQSNGDLWMLSTPNGKQGFFYETWQSADPQWLKVSVQATDCPRISPEFLEEQRSVMSSDDFRQEHMCEFIGTGDALFDPDLVAAAYDPTVKPI
jgi:hypothetical protein